MLVHFAVVIYLSSLQKISSNSIFKIQSGIFGILLCSSGNFPSILESRQ